MAKATGRSASKSTSSGTGKPSSLGQAAQNAATELANGPRPYATYNPQIHHEAGQAELVQRGQKFSKSDSGSGE